MHNKRTSEYLYNSFLKIEERTQILDKKMKQNCINANVVDEYVLYSNIVFCIS